MNNSETNRDTPFYITGGTLPPDATSYVERHADRDLLTSLLAGDYCYVLNSRQMGKSSLSVRTIGRLNATGVRTVFLDLTRFGGATVTPEQWYVGMLSEVGRALDLRKEVLSYWKEHQSEALVPRFFGAIHELLLESPLVLFIDEIDAVKSLPFSTDEFFAALRECYNRRVQDETMKRLTVCLVGSATPSDLIADTRTSPFNIGKRIEMRDFTLEDCKPLAEGLKRTGAEGLVNRVFHWTNGHPYLTQSLCAAIAEDSTITSVSDVDGLVAALFFEAKARERNPNLADVSNRILSSYLEAERRDEHRAAILDLYSNVLRGRSPVSDDDTNRLVALLKLAGITRSENGQLLVRNRIYDHVFDRRWIELSMPDAEQRRQKAAFRNGLIRASAAATIILVIMAALLVFAYQQRNEARTNAKIASQNATNERNARTESDRNLYFANMNLIPRYWDNNNSRHIEELLAETKKYRDKGFEWGYWNRLCHLDLMTVRGHTSDVDAVAFSPDGKKFVTGSHDHQAKVWDAKTGEEILTLVGHTNAVKSVSFSPDGKQILTGSDDKTAKIWDAVTGKQSLTFKGHTGGVKSVAYSLDGKQILTGSDDKTAKSWNALTGKEFITLKGHAEGVNSAAYSPDGTRIVTGTWFHEVKVWDAVRGRETLTLNGHTDAVVSVSFSPDVKHIVTGSWDNTAKVWISDSDAGQRDAAHK